MSNLFWWAPWQPFWQEVASITLYFVVWYGLGYVAGWFSGRAFLFRHMSKMMRSLTKQMLAGIPPSEWREYEHTESMAINVTPGVLAALHSLDQGAFIKAIWPTELPVKMVVPTMHMMRSGHMGFHCR